MANSTFLAMKILSIVIAIISIIGNALVCHIIVKVKSMKTSMNYIILNLAILDAMTGFLAIFFTFSNDSQGAFGTPILEQVFNKSSIAAEVLCKIEWTFWVGGGASPFMLAGIAYERYRAIVHPLSQRRGIATKKVVRVILCSSWMIGLAVGVFDNIIVTYDPTKTVCTYIHFSWFDRKAYQITLLITVYLIPSFCIFFFYLRVIVALKTQSKDLGAQGEAQRARRRARKRVIIVIIIATVMFFLCSGVPNVLFLANRIGHLFNPILGHIFEDVFVVLMAFNSAFNPVVYFIFIKAFRDGFKIAFKLKQNDVISIFNLNRHVQPPAVVHQE